MLAFLLLSTLYSVSTKSGAGITDIVRSSGLRAKLKACPSCGVVEADAYYDGAISTDTVVFDLLDGGSSTARRIDPVHLLLQFSDELDLYSVRRIILARNGEKYFTFCHQICDRSRNLMPTVGDFGPLTICQKIYGQCQDFELTMNGQEGGSV